MLSGGAQNEAKKATGKLYRWMMKEGIVDGVANIWSALLKFSTPEKRESHYEQLSYKCASVLWFAPVVHIEKPKLAKRAGEMVILSFQFGPLWSRLRGFS
jgi:hypothetical protein